MKDDGKNSEVLIESTSSSLVSDETENTSDKVSAASGGKAPTSGKPFRLLAHSTSSQECDSGEDCTCRDDQLPDCSGLKTSSADNSNGVSEAMVDMDEDQNDNENFEQLIHIKEKIKENWSQCGSLFLEIGNDLIKAKALFGKHGDWLDWLKDNVPFSVRQAQRLMRVAERFGSNTTLASHLDFSKAYILTRLPKTREDDFLEYLKSSAAGSELLQILDNKSKRELEIDIREYLLSLSTARHTREVGETGVNTSTATKKCSALNAFSNLKTQLNGLIQNVIDRKVDDTEYDTLIAEICELCNNILTTLLPTDVEPE